MGDLAAAIDENSDLPADFEAELREFAGEFVADDALRGDAAPGESLQPAYLAGLEAARVAVDADGATSLGAMLASI